MNNNQNIKVNTLTFESFFKNNIIYIPKYQREYSWEHVNVKAFIDDVFENTDYYVGNVMTRHQNGKLDIIDGQQRIITAFLVFIIIKQIKENKGIIFNFDNEILSIEMEIRLQIQDRAADRNANIIKYLFDCVEISDSLINTNEYIQFKYISSLLEKYTNEDIQKLYTNLSSCQIVNIDTTEALIKANKIFLNLNTKGMKLSNADIVKSIIFSFFEHSPNYSNFKNLWYESFYSLTSSEKDDYLSNYLSIYVTDRTTRISKKSIVEEFESILTTPEIAKTTFEHLAASDSIYNAAYIAVVRGDSTKFETMFKSSSARISNLFKYHKFIRKINFIQFNIALISMLSYEPNKKNKVSKYLLKYIDFIQLIFLFSCYLGLQDVSPSNYSNDFIKLAVKMRDKDKVNESIKNIITNFKSIKVLTVDDLKFFDDIQVKSNHKSIKYFVALISYLDGDTTCDYTGEHIYPESGDNAKRFNFANIIPVINDTYGSHNYIDKIDRYKLNIHSEIHIKKFLDVDFKDDYTDFIDSRGLRYKELFVMKFNELYSKLTQ